MEEPCPVSPGPASPELTLPETFPMVCNMCQIPVVSPAGYAAGFLKSPANSSLADLARRNSDEFLALLFAEFGVDAQRSQDWSSALVRYALERRPELAEVLTGWLETWQPRAFEAVESLAAAFASAPAAMAPGEVAAAAREQHHAYLERCGLGAA